jgi:hypothetical protein
MRLLFRCRALVHCGRLEPLLEARHTKRLEVELFLWVKKEQEEQALVVKREAEVVG